MKEFEPITDPVIIKTKKKYREKTAVVRNGPYATRTGRRKKVGYHKHRFKGITTARKYTREG